MIHHQPIFVVVSFLTSGASAAASATLLALRSKSTRFCRSASANASNPELRLLSAKCSYILFFFGIKRRVRVSYGVTILPIDGQWCGESRDTIRILPSEQFGSAHRKEKTEAKTTRFLLPSLRPQPPICPLDKANNNNNANFQLPPRLPLFFFYVLSIFHPSFHIHSFLYCFE